MEARTRTLMALAISTLCALAVLQAPATPAEPASQPNILIILTDDQRADLMSVMPETGLRFAQEGVTYANGFANTPLCCPARASIFTGRFAHNHGVVTNGGDGGLDHTTTLQRYLQGGGYRTGIVGKFFNGWYLDQDPPFFDRWAIGSGKSEAETYNVDGQMLSVSQYGTDFIRDQADSLIRDFESQGDAPWFLYVATMAPHLPVSVAPEYQDAPVEPWQPSPSVTRAPDPEITEGTQRMLMSVDELVDRLFQTLEELGEADNTLAFFASDNGFMWREHGLWGKNQPYTESIRVPFLARWPGHLAGGEVRTQPVAHVDLAPTILEAAGIPVPSSMDGSPLFEGSPRTDMLAEAWRADATTAWASLRAETYQYIEWFAGDGVTTSERAFYRLDEDPWQLENLLADSATLDDPDVEALHQRLATAMACAGEGGETGCQPALTSTALEVDDSQVTEGAGEAVFEVHLTRAADQDLQVPYVTGDGTATAPDDYAEASGELVIPAGQTSGQIVVPVVQDLKDEPDERFTLSLSSPANAIAIDAHGTATVVDDDLPALSVGDATGDEAEGRMTFLVGVSSPPVGPVSAAYSTSNGTASAGSDYRRTQGTLRIVAGQTAARITVPLLDDALDEPVETFVLTLSSPSGATLADAQGVGTIVGEDPPPSGSPQVVISDAIAEEGQGSMTFTVTLSEASAGQVSMAYATSTGTASAGADYKRVTGTLKIPAGQTSGTVTVALLDDALDEPDESFTVVLSSPVGATLADGEGTGTIVDDDP